MSVYVPHVYLLPTEKSVGFPSTRVMDGCEPPCGRCKLNLHSLQEQQMPLTTELSLQPPLLCILKCMICFLDALVFFIILEFFVPRNILSFEIFVI